MDKKNTFVKIIIFLLFILPFGSLYAQSAYQLRLDSIFNIPSNKITTGILIDRTPPVIDMQDFVPAGNSANAPVCNRQNWLEIFYRIYASHLDMQSFAYDVYLIDKYKGNLRNDTLPLGLIFYNYNKIKDNAVQNGLLSVDTINSIITDISAAGQTPVETAVCFAAAVLADTITTGYYEFVLKSDLLVSNRLTDIQHIYIDFGNGQGFVEIYQDLAYSIIFDYPGNTTLTVKITANGQNYFVKSSVYVKQSSTIFKTPPSDIPAPDFPPVQYENINIPNITAWYGIWYRCNHDNTIRKPLLIAAGFDPSDDVRIYDEKMPENEKDRKKKEKNIVYLYKVANKDGFLNRLRELGYDIIIYRSASSTESIVDNAKNLASFIEEKILNVKTSDNELIIMGASMGGLTVRHALTYMESKGIPHHTKLFISMDSPQSGANVPLGFQHMAYNLNKDLFGLVPDLKDAVEKMLDCKAARQMLLYHYIATENNTAACHTDRTDYLDELASIGSFPKKCTTIAIACGSGNGTSQGFAAGERLITKSPSPFFGITSGFLTLDYLLLLLGIPFPTAAVAKSVSWEFSVNAVPNKTFGNIYSENISLNVCIPKVKVKWSWLLLAPIVIPYLDCKPSLINRTVDVNNTVPLDNAPGCKRGWHNLEDFKMGGADDLLSLFGVAHINCDKKYDCFIPSYSALGMNLNSNFTPHTNIKTYLNNHPNVTKLSNNFFKNDNPSVSPFDYLYVEDENDWHICDPVSKEGVFSPELLEVMDKMISTEYLTVKNKTIHSGENISYEATEYIELGGGNFTVETGGNLTAKASRIVLNPGFVAEAGSKVYISAEVDWTCTLSSQNSPQKTRKQTENSSDNDNTDIETATEIDFIFADKDGSVKIFPNPVKERLEIYIDLPSTTTTVSIYEASGKQLFQNQYSSQNVINIDFSTFVKGTYIVKIINGDIITNGKVIKE